MYEGSELASVGNYTSSSAGTDIGNFHHIYLYSFTCGYFNGAVISGYIASNDGMIRVATAQSV
jgi:lipid-binding SYLF domain-containing protein